MNTQQEPVATGDASELKLNGLFAFKKGMSTIYSEAGQAIPVTVLYCDPVVITQIKTQDKDGYVAVQVGFSPRKEVRTSKAQAGHVKSAGFEHGVYHLAELRQKSVDGIKVGQQIALDSFAHGDKVKVTGVSKGHGFAGAVKRHKFGGGPAAHGSGFHRRPGSAGNRTQPGRVIKGKRYPGHFGTDVTSVRNVEIVKVIPEERVVMVKGPVPGAFNSLVRLMKQ